MLIRQESTSIAPSALPVEVDTTENGTLVVEANDKRYSVTLQNVGTVPCLLRLGGNPSATEFNLVLGADTSDRNGDGGVITLTNYTGEIKGLTESESTLIAVTEII